MTSHETQPTLRLDESQHVWDALADRVGELVDQWEVGTHPPELSELLPDGPPQLRRLTLVELIKVDLEFRWRDVPQRRLLEDYVAEFPELVAAGGIPCDLIYEELHVRRQAGDRVDPAEYFTRFPERATELERLLDFDPGGKTTSVTAGDRVGELEVGQRIDDFDLLARLGSGAFATVYLARQVSLQRLVALKVSSNRGTEPQTLAQLDHPNIVRVYDQRIMADRDVRLLYMQYHAGGTLHPLVQRVRQTPVAERSGRLLIASVNQALDDRGESPPSESALRQRLQEASWPEVVCWLGTRLASALDYAHRAGTLHRDVKPANVLLAADATPKLVDFNISFSSKLDGASPAAYFGGSLAYMSPEQLEACNPGHARQPHELDGRSDVYGLAVMLWELLCGRRPFQDEALDLGWSDTLAAMCARRQAGVPAAGLADLPPDASDGLKEVLLAALEPNRNQRTKSAAEFAANLSLCMQPHARKLMRPRGSWLRRVVCASPIVALAIAGVLPNAAVSGLNIPYNFLGIVEKLTDLQRGVFFNILIPAVNTLLYSLAVLVGLSLAYGMAKGVRTLYLGYGVERARIPALRRRCLRLPQYVSWFVLFFWISSGVLFPLGLQMVPEEHSLLTPADYAHFVASQTLCGLIAASLTYFFVMFVCVRCLYPVLLAAQAGTREDSRDLALAAKRVPLYIGMAVATPFLAVTFLVLINTDLRAAFGVLGGLGIVAFLLASGLGRLIQLDLATLATVVRPPTESFAESSVSVDSFWTPRR